jgi:hypothetical protein
MGRNVFFCGGCERRAVKRGRELLAPNNTICTYVKPYSTTNKTLAQSNDFKKLEGYTNNKQWSWKNSQQQPKVGQILGSIQLNKKKNTTPLAPTTTKGAKLRKI